jgi:DNA replication licensing factor MCM7
MARTKRPTVPPQVSSYIVDSYVRLRKVSKEEEEQNKSHSYTSARTLLGVLRLSQALARLRCADVVEHPDVDEALRLMECSKESLQEDADKDFEPDKSAVSQIFRLIKAMATGDKTTKRKPKRRQKRFGKGPGIERDMDVDSDEDDDDELSMVDIRSRVMTAGFTEVQLMDTIAQVHLFSPAMFVANRRLVPRSMRSTMCGCAPQVVRSCSSFNHRDIALFIIPLCNAFIVSPLYLVNTDVFYIFVVLTRNFP